MLNNILIILVSLSYAFVAIVTLSVYDRKKDGVEVALGFLGIFIISPISVPYLVWYGKKHHTKNSNEKGMK